MDDTRMDQLATLLEGALAVPLAKRDAFIREACGGDAALCAELGSLLEAHSSAPDYFADLATRVISPAYTAVTGGERPDTDGALLPQLRAAVGSVYHIERELGGGGMSRVFLAEEVKLARKVVVKVLPPAMSATVNADRFQLEIRLAAQLQHPHIVPLLTANSSDSLLYYTMPFVVGESLRARLAREGALPVADAIWIWRDVLDALTHAHASDVAHRDIKPANILLGVRNARVIDFGIARAIEGAADDAQLATPGLTIGTPAYMAPEQLTGDPHADHRVDIYAAGLVMYEMLEGRLPFAGETSREVALARLRSEPGPPVRADCPAELRDLVLQCIARDPAARPASAEEVLAKVENLPLEGGTTTVAARSAAHSAPLGPTGRRTRRAWRRLAYVVAAALVVTAATLAANGWRPGVAGASARLAEGSPGPAHSPTRASTRHTPSLAAYEWYRRGMEVALMRSDSGRRQGEEYFNRAIAEDSNFAAAYAGLVRMYLTKANSGLATDSARLARAEAAALKALSLDDSSADAHAAVGWVRSANMDLPAARASFDRAIALDPNVPRGHEGLARVYMWIGLPAEQLAAARIGFASDPYSHSAIRELALALMMNGQCDEALERLRPLKVMTPRPGVAGVVGGQCYAGRQMWTEAIAEFRWARKSSESLFALPLLAHALARAGQREEAIEILTEMLAGRTTNHSPMGIAMVYAGLGDLDQTFDWLDKAAVRTWSAYILGPMFRDVHVDPRFTQLKKRVGL